MNIVTATAVSCQAQGASIQLPLGFDYADYLRATDHDASIAAVKSTGLVEIPPDIYYDTIFHGDIPEAMPVLFMGESGQRTAKATSINELVLLAISRPAATPLATFAGGWRKKAAMLNLYGFVVDIENVSPAQAEYLVTKYLPRLPEKMQPTFIVLSGGGVHLVYHLSEPVAAYHHRKPALDAILKALKTRHMTGWEVDKSVGICHAVRVVGGATKYGTAAVAYRFGESIDIAELAKTVGVEWQNARSKTSAGGHKMRTKSITTTAVPSGDSPPPTLAKVMYMPNGRYGFWLFCLERVMRRVHETNMERRHMALFGLAVVAYKCRISKDETEKFINMLIDKCSRQRPYDPLPNGELEKAMTGYSQKFLMVKGTTLSDWLGVEFHPIKRNGRTQKEHLSRVHAKRRGGTRELILEYLREHPAASQVEVAAKLDLDRKTVYRYLKAENLIK